MADTTHTLRIKAELDTSQLQQELDRLNSQKGNASDGSSAGRSTGSLLTKLDNTLNKLNSTMQQFSQALQKSSSSAGSAQLVGNIGTGIGYAPFQRPVHSRTKSVQTQRMLQNTDFDRIQGIIDPITFEMAHQLIRSRESTPAERAEGWGLLRRSLMNSRQQLMNFMGPLNQQQQSQIDSIDNLLFAKRDMPITDWQSKRQNLVNLRDFRRQLKAFGVGTTASMVAGQLSQWGEVSDNAGLSLAGRVLGGAGAGAMTGAFFGPLGAALGAAFGALSQGALELVKSLKAAEEQVKVYAQRRSEAVDVARGGLNLYTAEKGVLGSTDYERLVEKARENLLVDTEKRADAYRELVEIQGQPYSRENAEAVERTKDYIKVLDNNIKENENIIESAKRRREVLDEEVLAGQRLAQAEREFSRSLEEAEYRQRIDWSEYSTSNIQANREALRSYRQQLASARASQMMAVFSTGIESQLGQIRTGTFTGNRNPAYWYKLAREQRSYIGQFQQLALGTGDLKKMAEYMRQAGEASQKFNSFMQMAQTLQAMQLGQPIDRVDLQGLTSLASRGGWMGENYSQPDYMATLDKMYDTLRSIDDNTREAEKNVWQ